MKDEIKEIIKYINLNNGNEHVCIDLNSVSEEALAVALEAYINSHYIAKEKVKGLKMEALNYRDSFWGKSEIESGFEHAYNQAVSEINKAIDDLVEDNK